MVAEAHATAYSGRQSTSTRNPHSAASPANVLSARDLARLSPEERIIAQWRAAFGCPLSDEAKAQFQISYAGLTFSLSDVRLWAEHHPRRPPGEAKETGQVFLEFFFDGSPKEIEGQEEGFTQAFERLIEQQLQEQRCSQFRKKLTTRRRPRGACGGEDAGGEAGGESGGGQDGNDADWKAYLRKPIPATELTVKSMREAGCMLRFLVCQTSISVSASEVLGQIAFQEHFPIDGITQEPSKSTMPLPQWIWILVALTAIFTLIALGAWWQILKGVVFGGTTLPDLGGNIIRGDV